MNKEIYILIGICALAFLIGQKVKKKFYSNQVSKIRPKKHRISNEKLEQSISPRKQKLNRIFTWAMLTLIFALLLYMIPALSRDLLRNGSISNQNLILRIIIVAFAVYILITGFLKLAKPKKKN